MPLLSLARQRDKPSPDQRNWFPFISAELQNVSWLKGHILAKALTVALPLPEGRLEGADGL